MSPERYVAKCPQRIKDKCPGNRYCRMSVFKPRRVDGTKGKTVSQKQFSALNKMRLINRGRKSEGRPRAELYKADYDKNGRLVPAKDGKTGHIYGFACYLKTEHQKNFVKQNGAFTKAFTDATKNVCTIKNGYTKQDQRSKCISDHISNDPDVIELKKGL